MGYGAASCKMTSDRTCRVVARLKVSGSMPRSKNKAASRLPLLHLKRLRVECQYSHASWEASRVSLSPTNCPLNSASSPTAFLQVETDGTRASSKRPSKRLASELSA